MMNRNNRPIGSGAEQYDMVTSAALPFDAGAPAAAGGTSGQLRQVVFIEGSVTDAQLLAGGATQGTRAVILDPNGDGVAQIAAYLAGHDITGLSAIDIVAHGSDGAVQLGAGTLSSATIGRYQTELATIAAALKPGGGIRLYGCDVAQDQAGVAFLDSLSSATGGAPVAAASHLVGSASGGGSWDLNVNTGAVSAGSPFTAAAEAAYPAELPASGTSELFLAFNINDSGQNASIERMAVSGGSPATGLTALTSSGKLSKLQGGRRSRHRGSAGQVLRRAGRHCHLRRRIDRPDPGWLDRIEFAFRARRPEFQFVALDLDLGDRRESGPRRSLLHQLRRRRHRTERDMDGQRHDWRDGARGGEFVCP